MSAIKTLDEIIWSKVDKSGGEDSCWRWTKGVDKNGYGKLTRKVPGLRKQITLRAHREAYKLANGDIPENMFVCHTCDNPSCCNPKHLFLGLPKDNTADMVAKGRWKPIPLSKSVHYGRKNGFYGKTHSEETLEKIRESNRRRAGETRKRKIS